MTISGLQYVEGLITENAGIPYAFHEWKDDLPEGVFAVGDYAEAIMVTREEDGRQETNFILRLYTQSDWLSLERAKERIIKNVPKTAILSDGTGIAIFYDSATVVPTGDAQMKSMKINLTIQEWMVK